MTKLLLLAGLLSAAFAVDPKRQSVYYPNLNTVSSGPVIPILRLENQILLDGKYYYVYQTGNGISAEESGQANAPISDGTGGTVARGAYQYTSPEGVLVQIQYVADENGFQPTGNVLPTPPPIPAAIQRSLEYNAAHPEPQQQYYSSTPSPYRV